MTRAVRLVAIVVAVGGSAIGGMTYLLSRPSEETIGGRWILSTPTSLAIESSLALHWKLQRRHVWKRVTVAMDAIPVIYIGDDCVVFSAPPLAWPFEGYEVRVACGDVAPTVISRVAERPEYDQLASDPIHVNGTAIRWNELKASARRGGGPP